MQNTVIANLASEDLQRRRRAPRTILRLSFWMEMLIFLLAPIPYYNPIITINCFDAILRKESGVEVYYLLSDFITAFMFIRLYFLIRTIGNYSKYTDTFGVKVCKNYGLSANLRFTFKCYITENPFSSIVILFVSSVCILGYLLRIFEEPYNYSIGHQDFYSYFASIWCIVISITTIGYGDAVPYTVMGRVLIMVAAIWGQFIVSLMIVSVTNIFTLSIME
jgi:hypothetical protein